MLYISGARLVGDEQVRIASTKIDGIGPKKAIQVRYRLGISGNIKIKELTKYQIPSYSDSSLSVMHPCRHDMGVGVDVGSVPEMVNRFWVL